VSPTARRGFRVWVASAGLSGLGDAITFFALAWVAASHGARAASVVLTVGSVPLFALVLVGGLAADRWGVRPVMVGCDLAMAAVMAAFAVGALRVVPVWALAAVSFLSGTAAALRRPAAGVFPRLFARDDELTRLMASVTLLLQLAQVTGPVVAGVLLASGGLAMTSAFDAVSFAVVGAVLLRIRPPLVLERQTAAAGWLASLREGVRAAATSPGVPPTIVAVCGLAVTILPLVELCVPLAGHARGWSSTDTSLVVAGWPAGGITVMAVVHRRGSPGPRTAMAGPVAAACGALLLAASSHLAAGVAALVLVGAGTSMTTARLFPRFVDATPEPMLARFGSLLQLAQIAPVLVATPVLGAAAEGQGVRVPLLLIGGALLVTTAAVRRADRGLSPACGTAKARAIP
jgi:hypothetical protein